MGQIGFEFDTVSPCCFHRESDGVSAVAHGDDLVFEVPADSFDGIVEAFRSHWFIKVWTIL